MTGHPLRVDDDHSIRQLLEGYFGAIDRRDWPALEACFAVDARMSFGWDPVDGSSADVVVGAPEIVAFIRRVEVFTTSVHTIAHTFVQIDSTGCRADSTATAVLEDRRDAERPTLRVRGLRYRDELVHEAAGWRIEARRHTALWEYHTPSVPMVAVPATEGGSS